MTTRNVRHPYSSPKPLLDILRGNFVMEDVAAEVNLASHKFQLTIKDAVYVISFIITAVTLYQVVNHRLDNGEKAQSDLYRMNETLVTKVDRMNESGTRRSHEIDAMQQQQIDLLISQVGDVNHVLRDLTPKVDKIDTNVLWLMAKQVEHK